MYCYEESKNTAKQSHSFPIKRWSLSPSLESGLTSQLVLTNKMWQKWYHVSFRAWATRGLIISALKLLPLLTEAQANLLNDKSSLSGKGPVSCRQQERQRGAFPGGSVVTNPPADAGDTASIPGPRGSHTLWSSGAPVLQLMSL